MTTSSEKKRCYHIYITVVDGKAQCIMKNCLAVFPAPERAYAA